MKFLPSNTAPQWKPALLFPNNNVQPPKHGITSPNNTAPPPATEHWAVSGCCPSRVLSRCSGSCLPLGGVRVLSRVLLRVLFRVLRIMFAIGVSGCCPGCCPGCSGSCLPLQGCYWGVLSKVLRIMFAMVLSRVMSMVFRSGCCPGCCPDCCQGAPDHVCHWAVRLGGVRVLSRVLSGAPDHVCHWAVSGCCLSRVLSRCSGSCLPLGSVRLLSRVLWRGAVQGAPDRVCYWAVSGCCICFLQLLVSLPHLSPFICLPTCCLPKSLPLLVSLLHFPDSWKL